MRKQHRKLTCPEVNKSYVAEMGHNQDVVTLHAFSNYMTQLIQNVGFIDIKEVSGSFDINCRNSCELNEMRSHTYIVSYLGLFITQSEKHHFKREENLYVFILTSIASQNIH